ncbi:ComEC/Rec2 family competence protein [Okibacterium fritillariae]|uniref:ComEC/Rec2 family competence protein n=1 Tax=Okibacterium fritillariae TaxID=123320 RepID=UPI00405579B5
MSRRYGLVAAAMVAWATAGTVVGMPGAAPGLVAVGAVIVAAIVLVDACAERVGRQGRPARLASLVGHARVVSRRDVSLAMVIALAASCAVAGVIAVRAEGRHPEVLQHWASGSRPLTADVTVTSLSSPVDRPAEAEWSDSSAVPSVRFRAQVSRLQLGRDQRSAEFPVLVFAPDVAETGGPPLGSVVRVTGRWQLAEVGDRVSALVFSDERPASISPAPDALGWAHGLRRSFVGVASVLPGWGGQLLPGLSIGDTSAVGVDLDAAMTASSLSHLTAVSGANCAIVVAIGFAIGAAMGLRRSMRIGLAVLLLVAFVVLVTPESSVIRASVMACAVLVALASGRPAAGLAVLCTVVVALLIADPWLSRDYGFALSVLATAGLLVLTRPLTDLLARVAPRPIAAAFALPLAAQLACQPVLVLLDPTLAVYGVVANLLAGPAAPAATILGLVACLLSAVNPLLALPIAAVAWIPAAWIAQVAAWFENAPAARLPLPPGLAGVLLTTLVLVLGGGLALAMRAQRPLLSRVLATGSVAVLGIAAGTIAPVAVRDASAPPGEWAVASCDVGQGDATVLRDGPHFGLIDVGDDEQRLTRCLTRLGVTRLDLLVLTHFDSDHVGAYPAVVGRVSEVLVGPTDGPADERIVDALSGGGAIVRQVRAGENGRLGETTEWNVLWPPVRGEIEPGNDASVVLETRRSFGATGDGVASAALSAVFLGDLGADAQNRLRRTRLVPADVDVVKVAHHGSKDQSSLVYERLRPTLGLVSVGKNDYGHPSPSILKTLERIGARVRRTDRDGIIAVGRPALSPSAASTGRALLEVWTSGAAPSVGGGG